jgi:hypothetical protein
MRIIILYFLVYKHTDMSEVVNYILDCLASYEQAVMCIQNVFPPHTYHHYVLVMGLLWSRDPESYICGVIATRRASQTGQVKSDAPD